MSNIELDQVAKKVDSSIKEQISSKEENSANVENRTSRSVSSTNDKTLDDSPIKSEERKLNETKKVVKLCYDLVNRQNFLKELSDKRHILQSYNKTFTNEIT